MILLLRLMTSGGITKKVRIIPGSPLSKEEIPRTTPGNFSHLEMRIIDNNRTTLSPAMVKTKEHQMFIFSF